MQAIVQEAIGRKVDFSGLQYLAQWVTHYLRGQGYFLARAYLPRQDVTEGQIEIAIVQGRLQGKAGDLISLHGENLRVPEKRLEAMAAATLSPDESIRQQDLERALLLMNDLPGVSAQSVLEPGEDTGTTRLNIKVEEGPLFNGIAWVDNYGSRYSGLWRANTQVNLNDPLGLGDQVRVYGTVAEDYLAGTVGYNVPLGHRGLSLYADVTILDYEIGKDLSASQLDGSATMIPARLVYPLLHSSLYRLPITNYLSKSQFPS